ncbi:bifunctional DNA-formamidopyrimidine glycosylase/DNA-(apurinic or apyrimidinic site) lyase [Candidatus Woesebacteria bacterium]|nr:bifunctional DNA-formamidopyrimidine glycosylase/DNA-(apurinic or apyrimidinic site) lyase [Candidatus Woesebacteria bacterium]
MPELPEIESIRLHLDPIIVGKTITSLKLLEPSMFHGNIDHVIGAIITGTSRKGKILTLHLTQTNSTTYKLPANSYISFHLKLSGQILFVEDNNNPVFKNQIPLADSNRMPARTSRIIIHFSDNSALYFNDMRKFGWLKVGDKPELPAGVDVLSDDFTSEYLQAHLTKTRRPIKTVLLDQEIIAGVGNIYANDALWEARIHPARKANSLTADEVMSLFAGIKKSIHEGLEYKGSSAKDELYVLPDSTPGMYQHHFKTYHQQGTPCKRCGEIIKSMRLGGRGTFYCPTCQKENAL